MKDRIRSCTRTRNLCGAHNRCPENVCSRARGGGSSGKGLEWKFLDRVRTINASSMTF